MRKLRVIRLCAALSVFVFLGCDSDDRPLRSPPDSDDSEFVGALRCAECHQSVYAKHLTSGHAEHFQRIRDGVAPEYVWVEEMAAPSPPMDMSWDQILFALGGTARSTVFVAADGRLLTGPAARWDAKDGAWKEFFPGQTLDFDCEGCHLTGYDPLGEHDGPAGLVGSWEEDGVSCENCHGPGRAHVESRSAVDIVVDRDNALCEGCHGVVSDHPYPENSDVINDWGHFGLNCVVCHDPHVSTRYERERAIRVECPDCHVGNASDRSQLHRLTERRAP